MANKDIRDYARIKDVRLWQIANALNINDGNFSRKLRVELTEDKKEEIRKIIDELNCGESQGSIEEQTTKYMSLMNEQQKQMVCAFAEQLVLHKE